MAKDLNSFDDFTGDWLSPKEVNPDKGYICKDVGLDEDEKILLTLENEGKTKKLSLNITNTKKCMDFCSIPKDLISRIIYFTTVETQKGPGVRISNIVEAK